jgi:hypothetical protein
LLVANFGVWRLLLLRALQSEVNSTFAWFIFWFCLLAPLLTCPTTVPLTVFFWGWSPRIVQPESSRSSIGFTP